jgi:lycopene cyclase domain-containing protein
MNADGSAPQRDERGEFRWRTGRWFPWWALLIVPFVIGWIPLLAAVRRRVNWKAAGVTVLIFEALLMPTERRSLRRGHWVYNESRILGPRLFGVPIEEPLIYYLLSPLIIISIFHGFLRGEGKKAAERRP